MKKNIVILFLLSICLTGCVTIHPTTAQVLECNSKYVEKPGLCSVPINQAMTDSDRQKLLGLVKTAKSNEHITWQNDATHQSYDFVSTDIYVNDEGQPCRNYTLSFNAKGFLHNTDDQVNATACRMDDMQWKLMNAGDES
jgi:surface antigen